MKRYKFKLYLKILVAPSVSKQGTRRGIRKKDYRGALTHYIGFSCSLERPEGLSIEPFKAPELELSCHIILSHT